MTKIGIRNKMNCGQYCEIIKDYGEKIDVMFDDGNIVTNKYYGNFKNGQISNSKDKVGETKLMNCGLSATITEYINYHNISVVFEDGYVSKNKGYDSFIKGRISHNKIKNPSKTNYDKRIGLRKKMNCGMFCEIIDYDYNDDIKVKFDDGTILEHRKYNEFKNGKIKNHNIKLSIFSRIGEESISADGLILKIIEYRSAKDIDVLVVSDNRIIKNKSYKDFKDKKIHINSYLKNKDNLIGLSNTNKYGESFKIIDYRNYLNLTIMFDNGYVMKASSSSFRNKRCYSPYAKTVYGIGCIGDGTYKYNSDIKMYDTWSGIFTRCYNEKYQKDKPTYIGCSIDEQWCNFQNFAEWYVSNYYELGDENMQLDKDILYKNNKIYSEATCLIVPQRINTMFTSCKTVRGKYPIGVNYKNNKYYARLNTLDKNGNSNRIELGYFPTPEDAFYSYKHAKESYIKQVADEYKSKHPNFPQKLYDAMYSYEVEITD